MKETFQPLVKVAALQEAYMLDDTQQQMTDFFYPIDFDSIEDDVWMKYLYMMYRNMYTYIKIGYIIGVESHMHATSSAVRGYTLYT